MKVIWILNSPIGEISNVLKLSHAQSGTWINGAMNALLEVEPEIQLEILTSAKIPEIRREIVGQVEYCCLNAGGCTRGKSMSKKAIRIWVKEIRRAKPDIIHIWGTEYSIGYDLAKQIKDIPIVYRIQGAINSISKYPNGSLSLSQMKKRLGWFDRLKTNKYKKDSAMMEKQAKLEHQMVEVSQGIISGNEWALMQYKIKMPNLPIYYDKLPIRKEFYEASWDMGKMKRHSLFCVAGRTAYKGLHNVIEAVHLLKPYFPDISLKIPGSIASRKPTWLFEPTYITYLKKLIADYGLEDSVEFLGTLNGEEMAKYMCQSHVFVMPSIIENESATLREAMLLGMPSVSTFVGDIYETVVHHETGLLYRCNEFEQLAFHIKTLFEDDELANRLGQNAKVFMNEQYRDAHYGKVLQKVYGDVCPESAKK